MAPRATWLKACALVIISVIPYVFFTIRFSFDPVFAVVCALLALIMMGGWLLDFVLRVTLTSAHLHVQHGVSGPKIPLEDILSVEPVSAEAFLAHQAPRLTLSASAARVHAVEGHTRGVAVRYRHGDATREAIIGSFTPEQLAASITRACHAAAQAPARGVGVDVDERVVLDLDAPVDAQAVTDAPAVAEATTSRA